MRYKQEVTRRHRIGSRMLWTSLCAGVLALLVLMAGQAQRAHAQADQILLRFVNASPDGAIDIYLGETPVALDLAYQDSTDYGRLPLNPTGYLLRIFAAGTDTSGTPLLEGNIGAESMNAQTFIFFDRHAQAKGTVLTDDVAMTEGAQVRFFHAAVGVPDVDITLPDGQTLFDNVAFGSNVAFAGVPAGTYTLQARPAGGGDPLLEQPNVTLEQDAMVMVVASGVGGGTPAVEVWTVPYSMKILDDYPFLLTGDELAGAAQGTPAGTAAEPTVAPASTGTAGADAFPTAGPPPADATQSTVTPPATTMGAAGEPLGAAATITGTQAAPTTAAGTVSPTGTPLPQATTVDAGQAFPTAGPAPSGTAAAGTTDAQSFPTAGPAPAGGTPTAQTTLPTTGGSDDGTAGQWLILVGLLLMAVTLFAVARLNTAPRQR